MISINVKDIASNSHLALNRSEKSVAASMAKLTSGKRINSAQDDPAGIAIAAQSPHSQNTRSHFC